MVVRRREEVGAVRSQGVPSGEHHHLRRTSVPGREGADPQWGVEIVPPVGAVVEQQRGALGHQDKRRMEEGVPDCRWKEEGVVSDAGPKALLQTKEEGEGEETCMVQVRWGSAEETTAQTSVPWLAAVGQD